MDETGSRRRNSVKVLNDEKAVFSSFKSYIQKLRLT